MHLVWATKDRNPLIVKELKYRLYDQMKVIAEENGFQLDFINGVEDHVHCLVSLKPKHFVSDVVKNLKGASSFWVNDAKIIEGHFSWQQGYAAFSVSPSNIEKVRNYIKNQEEHHRAITYMKELQMLREKALQQAVRL